MHIAILGLVSAPNIAMYGRDMIIMTHAPSLICQITAGNETFSDGERNYLPVLTDKKWITESVPFFIDGMGEKKVDTGSLFNDGSKTATNKRMTIEYVDNPSWTVVQALHAVAVPDNDNAISLSASYYANKALGAIASRLPKLRTLVEAWRAETEKYGSLSSELEKDSELKTMLLEETPWVIDAQNAKNRHNQDVDALKTKISVLQSRLDAELAEKNKSNPFAQLPAEKQVMLSDVYAIMEVVGKGENLAAKLINKNGDYFLVRKGTTLQTGHVIDEITETYIRGDIDGVKDYLYFTAGGILDSEPVSNAVITKAKMAATQGANGGVGGGAAGGANESLVGTAGIPSLGEGLFVR